MNETQIERRYNPEHDSPDICPTWADAELVGIIREQAERIEVLEKDLDNLTFLVAVTVARLAGNEEMADKYSQKLTDADL